MAAPQVELVADLHLKYSQVSEFGVLDLVAHDSHLLEPELVNDGAVGGHDADLIVVIQIEDEEQNVVVIRTVDEELNVAVLKKAD